MYECLPPRRATSAREEEKQEKTEPAITRQSLAERLPHEVQETEQPEVVDLDEEPEEEQAECPRGCGQRYPARLPGYSSLLPSVLITLLMLLSFSFITSPSRKDETSLATNTQRKCAKMRQAPLQICKASIIQYLN